MGNFANQVSWTRSTGTILVRRLLTWKQSAKKLITSLEEPIKMERKVILKPQCHIGSHCQVKMAVKRESVKWFWKEANLRSHLQLLLLSMTLTSMVSSYCFEFIFNIHHLFIHVNMSCHTCGSQRRAQQELDLSSTV